MGKEEESKLTKKQRKALEFKKGAKAAEKGKGKDDDRTEEEVLRSETEAADEGEARVASVDEGTAEPGSEDKQETGKKANGKGKAVATRTKEEKLKAKRDAKKLRIKEKKAQGRKAVGAQTINGEAAAEGSERKSDEAEDDEDENDEEEAAKAKKRDAKTRFIVFVGNMAFTTTTDKVAAHFAPHCAETPTVRLLTTPGDPALLASLSKSKQKSIAKGKSPDPSQPRSKGCAFVEFETSAGLQKALQFHHTMLDGRQINVELTAGGGGNSGERKERIKSKNAELGEERKAKFEKFVKPAKDSKEEQGAGKRKANEETAASNGGEGQAQWGRGASAGGAPPAKRGKFDKNSKGRAAGGKPWKPTGSNAVTLSG